MAVQTYTALTNEQRTFYEGTLIKRLLPYLPLMEDGAKGTVPANNGLAIQWRKWVTLALATSALTEGTTPTDSSLTINTVTATIAQYGAWVKASDILIVAGIDPAMVQISGLLGEQAGQSVHSLVATELGSGSSVRYANGRASRVTVAAGDNMTAVDVRKTVRDLENANAPRFPDGFYHGACTPKQKFDISSDATAGGFIDINKYASNLPLLKGEFGTFAGVRWRMSTQVPVFTGAGAAGIDVHAALIYGPDAYGIRDLETQTVGTVDAESNKGVSLIVVPKDQPSKADPLNQYGTAGWKVAFVPKVLDSLRIVRLETAVSA